MAKIEESVWLNAKPEEVWPYIAESEKKLQWLTELHEQEWLDEGGLSVLEHASTSRKRSGGRYAVTTA